MLRNEHIAALVDDGLSPEEIANVMVCNPSLAAYNYYTKCVDNGLIKLEQISLLENILPALVDLLVAASNGDKARQERLTWIQQIAHPSIYPIAEWKLKDAFKPPPIAHRRAIFIYLTMHSLIPIVLPSKCDKSGQVVAIKMKNKSDILEDLKEFYEYAEKHCQKRATLNSVAINVFLELINLPEDEIKRITKSDRDFKFEKFVCEKRTLERDIKAFKVWYEKNQDLVSGGIFDIVDRIKRWEMNSGELG